MESNQASTINFIPNPPNISIVLSDHEGPWKLQGTWQYDDSMFNDGPITEILGYKIFPDYLVIQELFVCLFVNPDNDYEPHLLLACPTIEACTNLFQKLSSIFNTHDLSKNEKSKLFAERFLIPLTTFLLESSEPPLDWNGIIAVLFQDWCSEKRSFYGQLLNDAVAKSNAELTELKANGNMEIDYMLDADEMPTLEPMLNVTVNKPEAGVLMPEFDTNTQITDGNFSSSLIPQYSNMIPQSKFVLLPGIRKRKDTRLFVFITDTTGYIFNLITMKGGNHKYRCTGCKKIKKTFCLRIHTLPNGERGLFPISTTVNHFCNPVDFIALGQMLPNEKFVACIAHDDSKQLFVPDHTGDCGIWFKYDKDSDTFGCPKCEDLATPCWAKIRQSQERYWLLMNVKNHSCQS